MKQSELWIGGEHVAPTGGQYFDDLNPSDLWAEEINRVARAGLLEYLTTAEYGW